MSIEDLLDQALEYIKADDNENAVRLYKQVLDIDPECPKALKGCGIAFANMRNFQAAIDCFTQAIQLNPGDAGAFTFRSLSHFDAGNYESALLDSSHAIELEPKVAGHYRMKGDLLITLKRYQEALECFEQVLKLEPSDTKYLEKRNGLVNAMNTNRFLPPLQQLKQQIDDAFLPFEQDRGMLDEDRANTVKVMGAIARDSTSLIENTPTNDLPLEPLMLYSYIQAVGRGCDGVRFYKAERSKEMLSASSHFFNQAEKIAEGLEDLEMLNNIHWKRGALMIALYKTWDVKEVLDAALQSYHWLDAHPQTTNSAQKRLVQERLSQIEVALAPIPNSSVSSSVASSLDNSSDSFDFNKAKKPIALGVGALGIVLFFGGQWFIGLICFGVAWYLWQSAY
ncbi:MAG TPA: hypothetical protein DCY88_33790 [Cyanobacteria bacterium UBA11372]|nr:hypothetical protein [Cyanobacteria bacterium UBA11372]